MNKFYIEEGIVRLRGKFIIPLFVLVIILGIVGGWLIKAKLENFQTQLLRNIAEEKSHEEIGRASCRERV